MDKIKHNHITRDIKPLGQCPACDIYHDKHIPRRECITHHHACDCREEKFKKMEAELAEYKSGNLPTWRSEYENCKAALESVDAVNEVLKSRIEKLREIISQININNPSFDDDRIGWIEIQIDRDLVKDIRAALKADEEAQIGSK